MNQWLQVELPQIKKITGIITQGAKSLGTEKFVTSYTLQYSDNGMYWNQYTDDEDSPSKVRFFTWQLERSSSVVDSKQCFSLVKSRFSLETQIMTNM